jgi:hypothetical protein
MRAPRMMLARLVFDLWRPVGLALITTAVAVLRDGRKTRTHEVTLGQRGKPIARCTAVLLRIDPESAAPTAAAPRPARARGGAPGPARPRPGARSSPASTHTSWREIYGAGSGLGMVQSGPPDGRGRGEIPVRARAVGRGPGGRHLGRGGLARLDLRRRGSDGHVLAYAARAVDPAERGDDGGRSGDGRHTWRAVRRRQAVRRPHADAHPRAPGRVLGPDAPAVPEDSTGGLGRRCLRNPRPRFAQTMSSKSRRLCPRDRRAEAFPPGRTRPPIFERRIASPRR